MKTESISSFQLFCLLILFQIGTAVMVPLGIDAKQDAWIAILLGMIGGVFIYSIYAYLHRQFPHEPLTSYMTHIVGKHLGLVLALLYALFFIYGAARDLRDGMELLHENYAETPIFITGLILSIIVFYSLYKGIEVLSRAGELYFLFFLVAGMLVLLCLLLSDVIDTAKVKPVLEYGWKPILKATYEQTIMFPFGEIICFTMVLHHLFPSTSGFKIGILSIIGSGVALTFTVFLEISVLGAPRLETLLFPFMRLMQHINIGDVIQRLDAFVLICLILNDFFKVAIFSYAALIAVTDVCNFNKNTLALPISIIIFITSLVIAPNAQAHFEQGRFALKYIFPPFIVYIPLLLLIIQLLRIYFRARKEQKA